MSDRTMSEDLELNSSITKQSVSIYIQFVRLQSESEKKTLIDTWKYTITQLHLRKNAKALTYIFLPTIAQRSETNFGSPTGPGTSG